MRTSLLIRLMPPFLMSADGGSGAGEPDPQGEPDPKGAPDPEPNDEAKPVTMTQAELDALINKAHGKGASAAEKKVKDYLEAQNLSEADRIKVEKDAATNEAATARAEALQARVEVAAERSALAAKVDPARVDRFMRLVDLNLDDVTADGKPDTDAIKVAVAKTLADFPEFTGATSGPGASGPGDFGPTGSKQWTREEIAALKPEEFAKHEAEISAQVKAGTVK